MKLLHFVDAAGTDEHYVPANKVTLVEITDNATCTVWWANSDTNVSDHSAVLTVTAGEADECLLAISEHLLDTGINSHGVITVKASTHIINSYGFSGSDISTVGYTAGS